VGLDDSGIPRAAEGTVVAYVKELADDATHEVVVFDLAYGKRLSVFTLESPRYVRIEVAGSRILASFDDELWSYALDGSDGLLLDEERPATYIEPSPHGEFVAISGRGEWPMQSVAIIEVETGDRIAALDLVAEFDDWKGEPAISRWLSDDELLVFGVCNCDSGPSGYFGVVINTNGTVERAPDTLAPTGTHRAEFGESFTPECRFIGYAGARSVALIEVATGEVLAEARESAPVFVATESSPDGTEMIVISLEADDDLREHLNTVLDSGECADDAASGWGSPRTLGLLRVGSVALEPIDSRLDVLRQWYQPLPVFECDGEQRAGWYARAGLESPQWVSPVGHSDHIAFTSGRCRGKGVSVDMRIGSVVVDTGAARYRVLGFFEQTPALED
jgi:hypothetical protein